MAFGKESAAHDENTNGSIQLEKSERGNKPKSAFARWGWLLVIGLIVLIVIIVLPVIYVGVPNQVQSMVNKSTLDLTYQRVANPTTDSVDVIISTNVTSHTNREAVIDAFTASLFLEDTEPNIKPFGQVGFPKVNATAEFPVSIVTTMDILDMDQFIAYNTRVLQSEEFRVALRGQTDVLVPHLPASNIAYNKVITTKGLNNFAGFNITFIHLRIPPDFDGATLVGTVAIPNPSVMELWLGNVTMALNVNQGQTYIGYAAINNMVLRANTTNNFDIRCYTNQTLALEYATSDYLLDIIISGGNVTNANGEHLPYYEEPMRSIKIPYTLNITTAAYGKK